MWFRAWVVAWVESTSERMRPEAEQDKQLGPNLERQAEWGDISEEGPTGLSIKLDVGGAGVKWRSHA